MEAIDFPLACFLILMEAMDFPLVCLLILTEAIDFLVARLVVRADLEHLIVQFRIVAQEIVLFVHSAGNRIDHVQLRSQLCLTVRAREDRKGFSSRMLPFGNSTDSASLSSTIRISLGSELLDQRQPRGLLTKRIQNGHRFASKL